MNYRPVTVLAGLGAPAPQNQSVDPGLPPDFVAPGPTELHPERWDLDNCTYTVAYGDTFVGITKTYLDPSGQRWREVWDPNRDVAPYPDPLSAAQAGASPEQGGIFPGDVLRMPAEACDNMRRWLGRGQPNVNPSQIGPSTVGDKARKYGWTIAGVGALAAALYFMS